MFMLFSVIIVCITIIFVVKSLQKNPITFKIHKIFEEISPKATELSKEDAKLLDEQRQIADGMTEVIRFTQEFLGGESDAESK